MTYILRQQLNPQTEDYTTLDTDSELRALITRFLSNTVGVPRRDLDEMVEATAQACFASEQSASTQEHTLIEFFSPQGQIYEIAKQAAEQDASHED